MVPACSHKVPRVSWYSGSRLAARSFAYGAFTLSGQLSQNCSATPCRSIMRSEPRDARIPVWAPSISLAATLEITFVFSSSGYLDVSVHRVPFPDLWIGSGMPEVCSGGFPHSDISGSTGICPSPKLFAAYHVFHRLLVPRHPPYALISITNLPSAHGSGFRLHMHSVACVGGRFFCWLSPTILSDLYNVVKHYLGCLDLIFLIYIISLIFSLYAIFKVHSFFFNLAATCSPTPSPA